MRTTREYVRFLNVAAGSAAEACYLIELAHRLGFVSSGDCEDLTERYERLQRRLFSMSGALEHRP